MDETARAGAITLGCLYLFFALTWVPRIVREPRVYDRWANFFEQFSIVSGALVASECSFAAAIALLSGRTALLAARLTTAMIAGFGLLVWLPAPFAEPHQITNWGGNAQNTAILGAA